MRILFVGEIVGKAGVFCVKRLVKDLRKELELDFVIANGDGATGGFGIGKSHAIYLRKLGCDVITGGDQLFFKKDMVPHMDSAYYMLRPANYPPATPGRGWRYYDVDHDRRIAVISMLGLSGFDRAHGSNPFTFIPEVASRARKEANIVILDFHATTTAEKYTMFHHADGMLSAVIGTGTRVQTADAKIMPKGTAVIGDVGRTGSRDSVAGLDPGPEIRKFTTGVPERSSDTWVNLELQGAVLDINDDGTAASIEPLRRECETPAGDNSND